MRRDAPAGRSDTRVPSGSLRTGKAMLGTRAAAARTTAPTLHPSSSSITHATAATAATATAMAGDSRQANAA